MKRTTLAVLASVLLLLCSALPVRTQTQSIEELIAALQDFINTRDFQAYLAYFEPGLRPVEEQQIKSFFDDLNMETVTLFKAYDMESERGEHRVVVRAFFENSFSVLMEMWQLTLVRGEASWSIRNKVMLGEISSLYKINIPSSRVERVRTFSLSHVDLQIRFQNAVVFYDNIPDLDTALIVIGEGRVEFSPSLPRERHQLELVYNKKILEDDLNYVYLRVSNSFFRDNIVMETVPADEPVSRSDLNKAYSLFTKHYSRSFTIENSLIQGLLSFLPQGDESVIEFDGKKIGTFTYIYSPFAPEEVNLYQWDKERILCLYSPPLQSGNKKFFISMGQKFDIKDYQIEIDFKPKDFYLSGKARIEIESKVRALDVIKLKISPELEILRVNDEDRHRLFFTRDKLRNTLYVYLQTPTGRTNTTQLEVFYRGRIEPAAVVADVVSGPQYEDRYFLQAPNFETYLYSRSAMWYPAPDEEDYFTARLRLIIPPDYSAVSNGHLIEVSKFTGLEDVEDLDQEGNTICVFQTTTPVKYLSFIVGKMRRLDAEEASIPIQYFKDDEIREGAGDIVADARRILDFYQEHFGTYPFEKLDIVKRLWAAEGGHSPASFIILNELARMATGEMPVPVRNPVNLSRWSGYYLAHEIAHQWWGQGVAWADYQDQWISEGLAQFSTILYLREEHGEGAFSRILKKLSSSTKDKTEWGAVTMGARLSYFDFEAYQAIVYNKTALVLNMLKDMLGDALFFRSLRDFYEKHLYGAANTRDFIDSFERVTGRDLDPFFDNWFHSYHLPKIRVDREEERTENGYRLTVRVAQEGELFVFPLWVAWSESGRDVRKMVIIDKRNQEFVFEVEGKPKSFKVDPDNAVPGDIKK